jgi:hypothetical protein
MEIEYVAKLDHNDVRKGIVGVIGLFGFAFLVARCRPGALLLIQQTPNSLKQKLEGHSGMIFAAERGLKVAGLYGSRFLLGSQRMFRTLSRDPSRLFGLL